MNWLALVAVVVAVGAWVFMVWKDRVNVQAFGELAKLIENIIDSVEDGE